MHLSDNVLLRVEPSRASSCRDSFACVWSLISPHIKIKILLNRCHALGLGLHTALSVVWGLVERGIPSGAGARTRAYKHHCNAQLMMLPTRQKR